MHAAALILRRAYWNSIRALEIFLWRLVVEYFFDF